MTAYERLPDWYKRELDKRSLSAVRASAMAPARLAGAPARLQPRRQPVPDCPQPETAWKPSA